MTTIINKYVGITNPISGDNMDEKDYKLILNAWKIANCPQGIHLWDECWSLESHTLYCDACGMEVYIEKIIIPDGKEQVIGNPSE